MSVRNWPDNNETASFDDMCQPFVDAIKFTYGLKRKNKDKDVPYVGLPLTLSSILAGCPQIATRLTSEMLEYDEDDQGRSALEVIVGCAIQIGIEQGHRMAAEKQKFWLDMIERSLEAMKDN